MQRLAKFVLDLFFFSVAVRWVHLDKEVCARANVLDGDRENNLYFFGVSNSDLDLEK